MKTDEFYLCNNKSYYLARDFEKFYRYEEACKYYEGAIIEDDEYVSPEMYINLAFIYWRASHGHEPSDNDSVFPYIFRMYSEKRFYEIINKGIEKFPLNYELRFWKFYSEYFNIYETLDDVIESYFIKLYNLNKELEPDTSIQEKYMRSQGFKVEYVFYRWFEHYLRENKYFPQDFDQIIKNIYKFTTNATTCKNRYLYETFAPFFDTD